MKLAEDKLLTVKQVSALIGFSPSVIYAGHCDTGDIPKIEFWEKGRKRPAIRFSYLDVLEWIATHRAQAKVRRDFRKAPSVPRKQKPKLRLIK